MKSKKTIKLHECELVSGGALCVCTTKPKYYNRVDTSSTYHWGGPRYIKCNSSAKSWKRNMPTLEVCWRQCCQKTAGAVSYTFDGKRESC
jgi:hypothetical protein